MECLLRHDLAGLTGILADICPVADDGDQENTDEYPLPAEHWINVPVGKEGGYKSLLHLDIEAENLDIGGNIRMPIIISIYFCIFDYSSPYYLSRSLDGSTQ